MKLGATFIFLCRLLGAMDIGHNEQYFTVRVALAADDLRIISVKKELRMTWADVIEHAAYALSIQHKINVSPTSLSIFGLHEASGIPLISPMGPLASSRLLQVVPHGMSILNLIKI